MDELWKQLTALDASLYGLAVPVALLIRFMRAYWHGFGNRATLLLAMAFGAGGAPLAAAEAEPARSLFWIITQGVSLMVAVLIAELGARKIPGLPADDQLANTVKPPDS